MLMNDNPRARCLMQLEKMDIRLGKLYRNLSVPLLIEIAIYRKEGNLSSTGAFSVKTGKFTGRSPDDKYIVDDKYTHNSIDWGKVNHPISEKNFEKIFRMMKKHIEDKELFIFDGFVGADPENRLPIRIINNRAWHSLFARQLFIRPQPEELGIHTPEFTLLSCDDFAAKPEEMGTRTETFIILNFKRKLVLIGATSYAGEIKKAMFSIMNFILPKKGVFPMHCSANVGKAGDTALFFGLSGTGKTTPSADPDRWLIGDDEHGWSEEGVFNFEGGCYAKVINLSEEGEPDIYRTTQMFGTVLENVVLEPHTRRVDFVNQSITENTRASYPLHYIRNIVPTGRGDPPRNVVFLTADAFGVLPPIARLTPEQAMYYFLSGYTAKVAGTERGVTEPQATFSACFGAVFLVWHPTKYAEMLGTLIDEHGSDVWLVNTGWTGGAFGVGKRMK